MNMTFIRRGALALACLIACGYAKAQTKTEKPEVDYDYQNAIGIRAGGTSGITFKHFFNSTKAGEFILGLWPNAIGLTGLYEVHKATGLDGLRFYYGGGGHFTAGTNKPYYRRYHDRDYYSRYGSNGTALGVDGIAGVEYKIGVIPLAISFDLKPFVEVSNYGVLYPALDAGLGLKLAF